MNNSAALRRFGDLGQRLLPDRRRVACVGLCVAAATAGVVEARADAGSEAVQRAGATAILPPEEWTPREPAQPLPRTSTAVTGARVSEYRSTGAVVDGRDAVGPLDVTRAVVGQRGRDLVLSVRTAGRWTAAALAADRRRRICFDIWRRSVVLERPEVRVCLRGYVRAGKAVIRARVVDARGLGARGAGRAAILRRPDAWRIRARIPIGALGLRPGRFAWRTRTSWTDENVCVPLADGTDPCLDVAPGRGTVRGSIARVRLLRCVVRGPSFVVRGSRSKKIVALTFDDGPSAYTRSVLRILDRENVRATFFVVGQMVRGRGALLREMLRAGHEIANHSWNHANLAAGGPSSSRQLAATSGLIQRLTGFRPCAFRAPYGAVGRDLIARARGLGMATIGWDVDTHDWTRPGSRAIYRTTITRARRGSIVLMHDGGGPRANTFDALVPIIRTLRARGYRFATVAELLGRKLVYGLDRG
jgi:peptidoglycan-N-acetylglucosamine deacetylase